MQIPAKILLFGEHIVLQGADALALPWPNFSGTWALASEDQRPSLQQQLPTLLAFLKKQAIGRLLDLERFEVDLKTGLYFNSNIPTGYGAGSSGALCAAIFHRYLRIGPKLDLPELKAALGAVESFFHGSSSGTDPLICYLNQAVLLSGDGAIQAVELPRSSMRFFVIDTGISRQTGPWVEKFLEKSQGQALKKVLQSELIPASNQAIQAILNQAPSALWQSMDVISKVHFQHLTSFIPPAFHELWEQGLTMDGFKLKICGAGGGGFILGLGKSKAVIDKLSTEYTIHSLSW
ncbi:MAG: mevalonate kinase [Saprospiraceae bacterium]